VICDQAKYVISDSTFPERLFLEYVSLVACDCEQIYRSNVMKIKLYWIVGDAQLHTCESNQVLALHRTRLTVAYISSDWRSRLFEIAISIRNTFNTEQF